jgi:Cu+-exporting ATPase
MLLICFSGAYCASFPNKSPRIMADNETSKPATPAAHDHSGHKDHHQVPVAACCHHDHGASAVAEPAVPASQASGYTCPMHPEVRSDGPGSCPKCGMALEPLAPPSATRTIYTCPMHPEIRQDTPGTCPICGMALEPETVAAETGSNPELQDMTRRFWLSFVVTLPLLVMAMGEMTPWWPRGGVMTPTADRWFQFALATPVLLWGGWPFFVRAWQSVVHRSLNMFTLIAMGTGVAYVYSAVAVLAPDVFPASFQGHGGHIGLYFEAAAVIVTLVLLGQVLELRANALRARSGRYSTSRRRWRGASAPMARKATCRSTPLRSATVCVCGRGKRYRSMALSRMAPRQSTNR